MIFSINEKKEYILSVSNGGRPVNNVTISIPNDHTSVAKLCGLRLAISLKKMNIGY
jgi:hypothetical protein